MRTTLNPPFEISRSATVMGSPKVTLVSLQCLFHFIVNRSVGRCIMEKGGSK